MSKEKTYTGREALVVLAGGKKLTIKDKDVPWVIPYFIYMNNSGQILNCQDDHCEILEGREYTEYQECKEPKKKQKYYKHHYKQKGSPLSDIKSTDWVMSLHYMDYYEDCELVATDEREF